MEKNITSKFTFMKNAYYKMQKRKKNANFYKKKKKNTELVKLHNLFFFKESKYYLNPPLNNQCQKETFPFYKLNNRPKTFSKIKFKKDNVTIFIH